MSAEVGFPAEAGRDALLRWAGLEAARRRLAWSGGTTETIESGEGPQVLFVHGALADAGVWAPLLARFGGIRAVAVDLPGHGLADPWDYGSEPILETGVRFLGEVMDALGRDRLPIVASSMGALFAVHLALREPGRVERLVIVGAPAGSSRHLPVVFRSLAWPLVGGVLRGRMARADVEDARWLHRQVLVAHPGRLNVTFLASGAAMSRRNAGSQATLAAAAFRPLGLEPSLVLDGRWQELRTPVTFLWGGRDAVEAPSRGRMIAAGLDDAAFVEIPDAGHLAWLDRPDEVAAGIANALGIPDPSEVVGPVSVAHPSPGPTAHVRGRSRLAHAPLPRR